VAQKANHPVDCVFEDLRGYVLVNIFVFFLFHIMLFLNDTMELLQNCLMLC